MADPTLIPSAEPSAEDGPLGYQKKLLDMARQIFILVAGAAVEKYGTDIKDEQEVLGYLSNIMIEIYAMESGLIRAMKSLLAAGEEQSRLKVDMVQVYLNDTMRKIDEYATNIVTAMETGDVLAAQLDALGKLARLAPINTVAPRRRIAAAIIDAEKYFC